MTTATDIDDMDVYADVMTSRLPGENFEDAALRMVSAGRLLADDVLRIIARIKGGDGVPLARWDFVLAGTDLRHRCSGCGQTVHASVGHREVMVGTHSSGTLEEAKRMAITMLPCSCRRRRSNHFRGRQVPEFWEFPHRGTWTRLSVLRMPW